MALLRLAAATLGPASVSAATVDHGLRAGSAAEAAETIRWCAALGVSCSLLRWHGAAASGGLQETARNARYALLCAAARDVGADAVVTAHTSDDQAETVMMRLRRGGGPRGLAGIRPLLFIAIGAGAPLVLMRPLLGVGRARLRTYLKSIGQTWIDDPSNEDERFERIAIRRQLAAAPTAGGVTARALIDLSNRSAAILRRLNQAEIAEFHAARGVLHAWGGVSFDVRVRLDAASRGLAARAIRAVGGGDHRPDEDKAAAMVAAAIDGRPGSLGGALIRRRAGRVHVWREPAALLGRTGEAPAEEVAIEPGASVLWDGRFIVTNPLDRPASLAALSADASACALLDAPSSAAASLPALRAEGRLFAAPGFAEEASFLSLLSERFDEHTRRIVPPDEFVTGAHGARLC